MELLSSQKNWNELGKEDPLWVVLTHPDKKGGKWDPSEFFATGQAEISETLQEVAALGKSIHYGTALDFGCGVGRLTQALAGHFEEVHGIDISPSMIGHARQYNTLGEKCIFHVNSQSNLELCKSNHFDFVYSNIALQHIEPKYSLQYMGEFIRVLKPGGIAVFQVRSSTMLRRLFPEFLTKLYRRHKFKGQPSIDIFGIPERQIVEVVREAGGDIVHVNREKVPEFLINWRWLSLRFVVVKSFRPQA
jgi:SAM-dependent methyltransferase